MSQTWHPLIASSDFPGDGKLAAVIGGWHILVARIDGGFAAVNDRCPHQGARLNAGRIRRGAVMCPLHGARFDMASGQCLGGSYPALRRFALRESDGLIEIAIPDQPPPIGEIPIVL